MSFRRLFRLNFEDEGAIRGTSSVPFFTKLIKNHFNIAIICYAYFTSLLTFRFAKRSSTARLTGATCLPYTHQKPSSYISVQSVIENLLKNIGGLCMKNPMYPMTRENLFVKNVLKRNVLQLKTGTRPT